MKLVKGIEKIYVPEQMVKGALYLSHKRTIAPRDNAPGRDIFEIFLPEQGVLEMTVEQPANIKVRPKMKTPIVLEDPYIVPRNRVSGGEGKKRARMSYPFYCKGFTVKEEI